MVMQDQSHRLATPLQWGERERTVISVLLALVAVAVIALLINGLTSGSAKEPRDCIRVTFASTLGGADLHGCGAQARHICASGDFHQIARELQSACGRAGFPYRGPG
jgi:hypothetical protein